MIEECTESRGVYQIELNGKKYVGSTANSFKIRWRAHLNELRKNIHGNKHLQNAFNKYGEDKLKFCVLEIVEMPEKVIIVEQKYIDELKPEYNMLQVAGSSLGRKPSEETKLRISQSHKKFYLAGGRSPLYGIKKSEEHKRNLSRAKKGKPSKLLGKHHSDELKLRNSQAHKGLQAGEKHPMWGVRHTQEYKDKMAISQKGISTGIKNPNVKLNELQVVEIKKLLMDGLSQSEIGRMFNISQHAVWSIKAQRTWSHIQVYEICKAVV